MTWRTLLVIVALTSGCTGPQGPTGAQGPAGPPGPPGPAGAAGSARAYAVVDPQPSGSPSLVMSRTKNFVSVTRPVLGTYCLIPDPASGIDRNAVTPVVGLEAQLSQLGISNNVLEAYAYQGNTDCPDGFEIVTIANPNPSVTTAGSNAVAFVVIVP